MAARTLYVMGLSVGSSQGGQSWLRLASASVQGVGVSACAVSATNTDSWPLGSVWGAGAPFSTIGTSPDSPGSSAKAPGRSGMCARQGWLVPKWANLLLPG